MHVCANVIVLGQLEHVIVIKLSNILHCNVNDHMPVIWIDKALTFVCYL